MDKILADIKSMKIQGAREVAKAGLDYVAKRMKESKTVSKEGLQKELLKEINRVIKVRPTEPMLVNSLAKIAVGFEKVDLRTATGMKKFISEMCAKQREEINQMLRRIAVNGAREIEEGDVIMTHCHSHNVIAVFVEAKRQKKDFKVIVTETRPLYQGIITARELLKAKIPITYCVDSGVGYFMRQATKVLIGFDALLPGGSITSKIGTLPIAITAFRFGKPFCAVGETLKFAPSVEIEHRNPNEIITPQKILGAKVVNPAFDLTPAEFISMIITEKGVVKPELIENEIDRNSSRL